MPEEVIVIRNLTKKFGRITAVNGLNLTVHRGDVFGFLGPNGAGKSTTIRMMLGLVRPSSGSINIFGQPLQSDRKTILSRVGAIVEKPDFYIYLTAFQNLKLLANISGRPIADSRIWEMLETVGLADRAHSKVKSFSHGMKQRLGIAQALLHDPDLIILDEPTTGLDPQGMKEIRDLIRQLSREQGKTIFLSSHILKEIEEVATRVVIIDKGSA
ncbi:MAG TPA: ABC transporter ATP-binding protein, partial [Caldithrix abyssi]|nr:ABC transporter ATP-binding protein [Caldithrix abyssi]